MKTLLIYFIMIGNAFAQGGSGGSAFTQEEWLGGGGSDQEINFDRVRLNLLQWVQHGRAHEFESSPGVKISEAQYQDYVQKMIPVLEDKTLVVSFVLKDDPHHEELRVQVDHEPKTCRSFVGKKDHLRHILCNVTAYQNTSPGGRYRLVHHEFASLAGVEHNVGAVSDYWLSMQLEKNLIHVDELRLPIEDYVKTIYASNPERCAEGLAFDYLQAQSAYYRRSEIQLSLGSFHFYDTQREHPYLGMSDAADAGGAMSFVKNSASGQIYVGLYGSVKDPWKREKDKDIKVEMTLNFKNYFSSDSSTILKTECSFKKMRVSDTSEYRFISDTIPVLFQTR